MLSSVVLGAVGAVLAGVVALGAFFNRGRAIRRALRAVRGRRIAELVPDVVQKVKGRVRGLGPPLTSPLGRRPCVYWRVVVEKQVSIGKNKSWEEMFEEADGQRCLVEDETGAACLDLSPREGEQRIWLAHSKQLETSVHDDTAKTVAALLERRVKTEEGVLQALVADSVRLTEYVLSDQEIVVGACVRFEPDPGGRSANPREAPTRAVLAPAGSQALLVVDDPDAFR